MKTHQIKLDRALTNAVVLDSNLPVSASEPTPGASEDAQRLRDLNETAAANNQLLREIGLSLSQLTAQTADIARQVPEKTVQLAVLIVKKLVGSSEQLNTERLTQLLLEGFSQSDNVIKVHVHPDDRQRLQPVLTDGRLPTDSFELVTDERVGVGECKIDFPSYALISQLETQVEEMEHRLLEAIHG